MKSSPLIQRQREEFEKYYAWTAGVGNGPVRLKALCDFLTHSMELAADEAEKKYRGAAESIMDKHLEALEISKREGADAERERIIKDIENDPEIPRPRPYEVAWILSKLQITPPLTEKGCCEKCLPHTKLRDCYNPKCECHSPLPVEQKEV